MTISSDILFPQLTSWQNLWRAYEKAARGKRSRFAAASFEYILADQLLLLQHQLQTKQYQPGPYTHFYIHEPKRRLISAAPFRDRVVHHALVNLMEPIFEAQFYHHSYANRIGKGTHRAVQQCQQLARRYRYVLRLDVRQHFASLDHAILKQQLFRLIKDPDVRWLIEQILHSGAGVLADEYEMVYFANDTAEAKDRPRGLPIGNLTSQFWSNCYLNSFDWFVVRTLGCSSYLRYVDDFVLFSNNKTQLQEWLPQIITFLAQLRLTLHEKSAQVNPVHTGIPWLGFQIFPTHKRLKQRHVVRFSRRFATLMHAYQRGNISFATMDAVVQGWINYVRYGDTWGIRRHIFAQ